MYRAVLAVVLAAALLGAASPAIEQSRRAATDTDVASQIAALEAAADRLVARNDPVDSAGARRVVELRLPEASRTDAGVRRLTLRHESDHGLVAAWGTPDDTRQRERLDGPLRPAPGSRLTLGPGRHRLVLRLRGATGDPVVHVDRLTGDGDQPDRDTTRISESEPIRPTV